MPAIRNTPKRRRMACPICRRDVSFTNPWLPSSSGGMARDYNTAVFKAHNNSAGRPCDVNGEHGFGYPLSKEN